MKSIFNKAKPALITAAVAIVAVYVWNNIISPRFFGGKWSA